MATNIRIIHARDLIRATPDGHLDFNEAKRLLMEIVSASPSESNFDVILDTRNAQSVLGVVDVWYLAAQLSDLRKATSRKTAVLCPLQDFNIAGFFALCAENRGLRVQAFTSFEDAINWILEIGPDL